METAAYRRGDVVTIQVASRRRRAVVEAQVGPYLRLMQRPGVPRVVRVDEITKGDVAAAAVSPENRRTADAGPSMRRPITGQERQAVRVLSWKRLGFGHRRFIDEMLRATEVTRRQAEHIARLVHHYREQIGPRRMVEIAGDARFAWLDYDDEPTSAVESNGTETG